MTEEDIDYERGARAYCTARGWDPDEVVAAPPHPKGYAVARKWPRWASVVDMLREQEAHHAAMAAATVAMETADEDVTICVPVAVIGEMREILRHTIHGDLSGDNPETLRWLVKLDAKLASLAGG